MKQLIHLLLICTFIQCSFTIEIGGNGYQMMNKSEKSFYAKLDTDSLSSLHSTDMESLLVFEINDTHFTNIISTEETVWFHLWRPYCKQSSCKNVSFISDYVEKLDSPAVQAYLISEIYETEYIQQIVDVSNYQKPVFVLENDYYGKDLKTNRMKVASHLLNRVPNATELYADDFIFKNGKLIFVGDINSFQAFDSIFTSMQVSAP